MIDDSPLITVTIPCYRQGDSLKKAIDSVTNQTYENLEILISEDPSDLESSEIIKQYEHDKRIKYFKHPSRVGRVKNYQSVFNKITGELAVNLDGDDYFENEYYIERCAQEFFGDQNLVLSVSGIRVNKDGVIHELLPNASEEVTYCSGRDYFLDSILDKTRTNHHFAMMYKVEVAKRIGFYLEDIASTDLESFRRLALHGNVVQINQISGVWNIGDSSVSRGLSCLDYANNSSFITNPLLVAKKNNIVSEEGFNALMRLALARYNFQYLIYCLKSNDWIISSSKYIGIMKEKNLLFFFPARGMLRKYLFHAFIRIFFGLDCYNKILQINVKIKNK